MRAWAVAVVVLLAGCSTPSEDAQGQDADPAIITDPRDLSYLQNATPGSHVHDYWEGRSQVTVVEDHRDVGRVTYFGSSAPVNGTVATFQPPEGTVVLQGTGRLEAVANWQDSTADPATDALGQGNAYTRVELWVKTAASREARPVAELQKGVPVSFNTTNEEDDPPHYTLSLWEFSLVFWNDESDRMSFGGTLDLKVEAFRTLPLVLFPPHMDRWNGTRELVLRDFSASAQETHLVLTYACNGGCLPWFSPDGGLVVPYDAREVVVLFEPAPGSTPTPVVLDVHGADSRSFRTVAGQDAGAGALRFSLTLDPGMADSPYAFQSLWEFRIRLDTPMEQGAWQGDYHVKATALR